MSTRMIAVIIRTPGQRKCIGIFPSDYGGLPENGDPVDGGIIELHDAVRLLNNLFDDIEDCPYYGGPRRYSSQLEK